MPELAHVVIGLEATSHKDADFVATCVLNLMMGGGGSFSAGGPGKGMYTRLYTNIMNQFHWIYSATATNHSYADSGLFCIHVSAQPQHIGNAVRVILREMVAMATPPGTEELRRAKTQLQSMLLMNLEARPVVFEDIGRQVLASGHRKNPEHYIQQIGGWCSVAAAHCESSLYSFFCCCFSGIFAFIEQVTADDIVRVAKRLLSSPPSIAARGNIRELPPIAEIQKSLVHTDPSASASFRLPNLSLFR